MAATKKTGRTAETKKKPKFKIPKKGAKCAKIVQPKDAFHKGSFRWTSTPDRGKGRAVVMVGCPWTARTKAMPRKARYATKWNPSAPLGRQCTFAASGEKAGLRAHMVVQPRSASGGCRTGYSRD